MSEGASRIVVLLLWPWQHPPLRSVQLAVLRGLMEDLKRSGIELIPWPLTAPWSVPPPENWRDWESQWRRGGYDLLEELERWGHHHRDWERYEREWPWYRHLLETGFEEAALRGLLIVSWGAVGDQLRGRELERFLTAADAPYPVVHVNLESSDPQFTILSFPRPESIGIRPDGLRVDRELVLKLFISSVERHRAFSPERALPKMAPPAARVPAPMATERATGSPSRSVRQPDEVHLGTAAPAVVAVGEAFVARFAAYTEACRTEVRRVFEQEAPSAQPRLDLERCRWHAGTKVTVRLDADQVEVANPIQSFKWNGTWQVLRFDARVHAKAVGSTIVLRFDIAVEDLPVLALRPELRLLEDPFAENAKPLSVVETRAPRSAFASYARSDRREVLGRVRSVQIFTGIDVFLDCLSIRPGEEWKPRLDTEIRTRDVFWLFWSRTARDSEWVDWEWRTALRTKSLGGIQPHPLEPVELAPPPQELSALEFGSMYEWYLVTLRQSWFSRHLRLLWHVWLSAWGVLRRMTRRA